MSKLIQQLFTKIEELENKLVKLRKKQNEIWKWKSFHVAQDVLYEQNKGKGCADDFQKIRSDITKLKTQLDIMNNRCLE